MDKESLQKTIERICGKAKEASFLLALLSTQEKNSALEKVGQALLAEKRYLLRENQKDIKAAEKGHYPKALLERLTLNEKRIQEMASCIFDTAQLKDPLGEVIQTFERPNGLIIKKVRVPIGVIGIIYESRPNVTSDCIGLCLKSGNTVILKGGKEAIYSNNAVYTVIRQTLRRTKIPQEAVQFVRFTQRQAVPILLTQDQYVDLIVPRGGEKLIRFVVKHSRIPVVKHAKGVCHSYVSDQANLDMARTICFNAKVQRPGVCNAMETMLVHKNVAKKFLPKMIQEFQKAGVEIRGCPRTRQIVRNVKAAAERDWYEEYLDLILAVRVVEDTDQAIEHIQKYGSRHSDAIVTEDKEEAEKFLKAVDSACLYVNASTRFTDGYQFGFGAEVGISTDKLHARGPMGLEELTTYKYLVYGSGQVRT